MKENQCRIRTLEGIWNPVIERDYDYLVDEFEDAIGELKVMNRRMYRRKKQKARIEEEIKKWQALLTSCVDVTTGQVDREREEYYWERIKEAKKQLEEIKSRPVPANTRPVDYSKVRIFLKSISRNWHTYSLSLRNRLLKLIIEKVEIRGQYEIKATIFWKNGFRQGVMIHRPPSNSRMDRRWSEEEELLQTMYQSSSVDTLMAALPGRSWKAITLRAYRLKLRRNKGFNKWRSWSKEDDKQLMLHCERGIKVEEIANKLGRSAAAIIVRLQAKCLSKPLSHKKRMVSWEISDLLSSQQLPSREEPRG